MSTYKIHLLEVYDADDLNGTNPVRVTGIGTVRGPEKSQYYILEPTESIRIDDVIVRQIAVRPHYEGDQISRAVDSVCTVGIALSRPDRNFEPGQNYGFADFCFWKVGKIHPVNCSD